MKNDGVATTTNKMNQKYKSGAITASANTPSRSSTNTPTRMKKLKNTLSNNPT
jgi:hypothetical protein